MKLGFHGGSISIPGRIWPQRYCVWAGAEPFPHRANATFRQVPGDLPFANIPLSVDFTTPKQSRGFSYFQDLCPTTTDIPIEKTVHNIMAYTTAHHPRIPIIQLVCHNDQSFEDPDSPAGKRYLNLLSSVGKIAEKFGYEAVSANFDTVCKKILTLPLAAPIQWQENNDVI